MIRPISPQLIYGLWEAWRRCISVAYDTAYVSTERPAKLSLVNKVSDWTSRRTRVLRCHMMGNDRRLSKSMRRQKYLVARDGENVKFAIRLEAGGRAFAILPKFTSALDVEEGYMMISGGATRYRADHFRYPVFFVCVSDSLVGRLLTTVTSRICSE